MRSSMSRTSSTIAICRLFKQANAEFDVAKRYDIIHEMQLIDHNEGGLSIYAFPDVLMRYSTKVHGFVPDKLRLVAHHLRVQECLD